MDQANEQQNLVEIAGLSQRGRTLSILDLMEANTLSAEMAAYALYMMSQGASVLTAAMPGNAGKTTLLACLLTGVPPDSQISTVVSPTDLKRFECSPKQPTFLLIHEIGAGPWYGYLWGEHVAHAFELIQPGQYLASCIHADTLEQLHGILTSSELDVPETHLTRLDLICFLHLDRVGRQLRRRVARMYEAFGGAKEHRLLFEWDREQDGFQRHNDTDLLSRLSTRLRRPPETIRTDIASLQRYLQELAARDQGDFRRFRRDLLGYLSR